MESKRRREHETDKLGILSLGFFLILLGLMWMITPDIANHIRAFFSPEGWHLAEVSQNVFFLEPNRNHPVLYNAASFFCLAFGAFQIIILGIRVALRDALDKIGGTLSGMVFWVGMGYFFGMLANNAVGWFGLLAGFVIFVGISIILQSIFRLIRR
ncbi:MAG: hypothetical protein NO515_06295 [Candidatus Methanomethylicia archaeon]|jgi:hypothetical protein|nr:hypothetical protein [Candidatus Methanomethylicia archaeon]